MIKSFMKKINHFQKVTFNVVGDSMLIQHTKVAWLNTIENESQARNSQPFE